MIHGLPLVTRYTNFTVLDVERELYEGGREQYVSLDEKQLRRKETEVAAPEGTVRRRAEHRAVSGVP
jgi:hypothetical protein